MSSDPKNSLPKKNDDDDDDNGRPWFHDKDHYDLNSKIMLTAIISLSVVVVLVLALHIYARYVLRRQARRRRVALRQLGLTVAQARSDQPPPPKTGLEPSLIASLPLFAFKGTNNNGSGHTTSPVECAVCLSILEDQDMVRLLPNCNHTFHADCIDKWFSSQSTCPICRAEAEPWIQPEPREGPVAGTSTTPPSAPLLERLDSVTSCMEGTSEGGPTGCGGGQASAKIVFNGSSGGGSSSRLSSFRRMLSRERSSRRIQPSYTQEDFIEDLERQ